MHVDELKRAFRERFGREPQVIARAPGRVNLIGEHTDYNDGFVLPLAIERAVWCALAPRQDGLVQLQSLQAEETVQADISRLQRTGTWADYPLGAVQQVQRHGATLSGMDALFWGDVPLGAGLSSSAAIEVATVTALAALFELSLSPEERIDLARGAEVEFVGVNCGIMDQSISVLGRAGRVLFLDCRSRETRLYPISLGEHSIMIIDSKKPRELAQSKYNERRAECEQAVAILQEKNPGVRSLRDVHLEELEAARNRMPPVLWRRARHVVTENARVLASLEALRWNNLSALGSLLLSSHLSLKDDYEVSCDELDFLVDEVMLQPGSLGARLTGAGFGGCTLNLVETAAVEGLFQHVAEKYQRRFGWRPERYQTGAGDGAGVVHAEIPKPKSQNPNKSQAPNTNGSESS